MSGTCRHQVVVVTGPGQAAYPLRGDVETTDVNRVAYLGTVSEGAAT